MSPTEIICGLNAVREVLRAGTRRAYEVFIASGKSDASVEAITQEADARKVPVRSVPRQRIEELSRVEKHQGIAVRVDPFSYSSLKDIAKRACAENPPGFVVLLDEVIDPQNVGSLIRTAHLTGAAGFVVTKDRCAPIGPATTRAAAGATEYLSIAMVTNMSQALKDLKESGFWVVGAEGDTQAILYEYVFTDRPHAIVMGSEGRGIRRLVRENCDTLLAIPMYGKIGSYNVSVAGAVFMGEVMRQRYTAACKNRT